MVEFQVKVETVVAPVAISGLEASSDGPTPLGSVTHFTAGVSQGTNVQYAWTFGDGSSGAGSNPTHTYGEAGSYTVRVTASNSVNQATTTSDWGKVQPATLSRMP